MTELNDMQLFQKTLDEVSYPEKPSDWKFAEAEFTEETLTILGHPVMEGWEKPYMKDMAAVAASNGGTVLEFGFGMGISARYLQAHAIEKHIIIEANADVFAKLMEFAQNSEKIVIPIFGLWEDVISLLADESIDGIFFDTYPLTQEDLDNRYLYFVQAHRLLKKGGLFTYFSGEPKDLSAHHAQLHAAGFRDIQYRLCEVNPPKDCTYWKSDTIVTPMIRKD